MYIPQQICPECMSSMVYTGGDIKEKADEIIRIGDYYCKTCNRHFRLTRRFEESSCDLSELE